jgi:hypothetical protein
MRVSNLMEISKLLQCVFKQKFQRLFDDGRNGVQCRPKLDFSYTALINDMTAH